MGTSRNLLQTTIDVSTQLKDAGAITATGPGKVGGVNRVVNLGAAVVRGTLMVDIAALDVAGGDEAYDIRLQGSTDPTFASNVSVLARVEAGATSITGEDSAGVGRRSVPFINTDEAGNPLPYVRAYAILTAGAGTASIDYQAFIVPEIPL